MDVKYINPNGIYGTKTTAYEYINLPTISDVTPQSSIAETTVNNFTVTGTNIREGTTVKLQKTGETDINCLAPYVYSIPTQVSCTLPLAGAATGLWDVQIATPLIASLSEGFEVLPPPPQISTIIPSQGPKTGGTSITITGNNFISGLTVSIGETPATDIVVVNSTEITATTPAVPSVGYVDVVVTNPDTQSDVRENGFLYEAAQITDASQSVFSIIPADINDSGTDTALSTIVIKNETGNALAGKTVRITHDGDTDDIIFNPPTQNPDPEIYEWTTNENGQIFLDLTSTKRGIYSFLATVIEDSVVLNANPELTVSCTASGTEQCLEIYIEAGAGELTLQTPSSFLFPAASTAVTPQNQFSIDDPNYVLNVDDVVAVTDTRNDGGFILQIQATSFADYRYNPPRTVPATPQGQQPVLPSTFYAATKAAATEGEQSNGIEYDIGYLSGGGIPITASINTAGPFNQVESFTQLTGNRLDGIVDLMDGTVPAQSGHQGTFKQNIQFYLQIPAHQPPGQFSSTITYDLISS